MTGHEVHDDSRTCHWIDRRLRECLCADDELGCDQQISDEDLGVMGTIYLSESPQADQHSGRSYGHPSQLDIALLRSHCVCTRRSQLVKPDQSGASLQLLADIETFLDELDQAKLDDDIRKCALL